MSRAFTWAIKQQVGDRDAKLLLLCLANHADTEGVSFPSVKTLAAEAEMSERNVQYKIQFLRKRGFLQITPSRDINGRQRANIYRLLREGAGCAPLPGGVQDTCTLEGATALAPGRVHLCAFHIENPHKEPPEGTKKEDHQQVSKDKGREEGKESMVLGEGTPTRGSA